MLLAMLPVHKQLYVATCSWGRRESAWAQPTSQPVDAIRRRSSRDGNLRRRPKLPEGVGRRSTRRIVGLRRCANYGVARHRLHPGCTRSTRRRRRSASLRPERGWSCKPATPCSAKRRRNRLICTTVYPTRSAISTPGTPCAISKTARARRLSPPGVDGARCRCSRVCRSRSLTTIGRTRLAMALPPENIHG